MGGIRHGVREDRDLTRRTIMKVFFRRLVGLTFIVYSFAVKSQSYSIVKS